jgi:UPF0716 protein FxsA
MSPLILLFILVPAAEVMLVFELSDRVGGLNTLLVILITGVLGYSLARNEGLQVLERIQRALERGEMPRDEIVDGLMILVAGALLVTPGFLTDAFGLLVLLPLTRPLFRRAVLSRIKARIATHGPRGPWPPGPPAPGASAQDDPTPGVQVHIVEPPRPPESSEDRPSDAAPDKERGPEDP